MTDLADLPAIGSTPIPGASPGGENCRSDPEYDLLSSEISKLENPGGTSEVDWNAVATNAIHLLSNRSKDLLVAAYLCRAMHHKEGIAGIAATLALVKNILTTCWDTCFPALARLRARRSALEWIGERVSPALSDSDTIDVEKVQEVRILIDELDALAREKFDGEDSGLSPLKIRLNELQSAAASSAPAEGEAASEGGGDATSGFTAAPVASSSGGSRASGPVNDRAAAIARLKDVAAYYRRNEPHSPVGFLVERAVGWGNKTFPQIMEELLKHRDDARDQIYDTLGIILKSEGQS